MEGLGRSLRFWTKISFRTIVVGIAFAAVFGVLIGFTAGSIFDALDMINLYLVLFGILLPVAGEISGSQYYIQQALSMGAGRKNTCIGMQVMDLIVVAVFYFLTVIFQTVANQFGSFPWLLDINYIGDYYWIVALVMISVGNLLCILTLRYGKVGFIIFICCMGVFGGIFGFLFACAGEGNLPTTGVIGDICSIFANFKIAAAVIGILLYIGCNVFKYAQVQKYEVRA